MADNFPLTPGTGRNVATDQVTYSGDTADVQLFRPVSITGAEGSKTVVDMPVGPGGEPRSISHRDLQRISVEVTGTSTTAYTSGDQVGTLCTLANAARVSGGTGMIVGVSIQGYNDGMGSWDVVFFDNSSVTLAADNAVFNLATDADILESVAIAQLAGSYDLGANRVAQAYNLAIPYFCSGGTSLYAALLTRGSFTNAAGETLQLVVYVERN